VRSIAEVHSLRLRHGRTLCARRWPGAGSTLVFLHGLLDSSEGWTPVCEAVGGTRIAFDLPGFGYSDPPPSGSLSAYAQDIAEGLQALGSPRFTLVGHSLGGAVAAALAELLPSSVDALVLLAPAGFGRIGLADAISLPGVRIQIWSGMGHDPMRERREDVIAFVAGATRPRSARDAERHAA
jgi:pimeloyl-ACP methyl ester carboxylesterase